MEALLSVAQTVLQDTASIKAFIAEVKRVCIPDIEKEALWTLAAGIAAQHVVRKGNYKLLATKLLLLGIEEKTRSCFSQCIESLFQHRQKSGKKAPLVSLDTYKFVRKNRKVLDEAIDNQRNLLLGFFSLQTLLKSYLLRTEDNKLFESPQHMFMRVACGIHCGDTEAVLKHYHLTSKLLYTHATPTLFNAGTPKPQLSSCFLMTVAGDSIPSIFDTLKNSALISQHSGGLGISVHKIRAEGAPIAGTGGKSRGLLPMLRVFNNTARYVDQGGGKRKGAFAVYLEPWHLDVESFLELRKNTGSDEFRARDLFYALWVPDLFMQRVEKDKDWTLMCPNECPGLADCYGAKFELLYDQYEKDPSKKLNKRIKARSLFQKILTAQLETGTPYFLFKDAANRKSNQQNLGTIRSSNLCTEIIQYTSPKEIAVCNLASLALPKFLKPTGEFDHRLFQQVVEHAVRSLDKVIDRNYYPVPEARVSNLKHRPMGLGVQGLADVFMMLNLPFDSKQAKTLNKEIFESLYFSAVSASCALAKEKGAPYSSFKGSPASKGLFQFDLWEKPVEHSGRWDWNALKEKVKKDGMRNSLLVAPMPTASTSQILGNNECFEPYTSNLYTRRTLAGDFVCANKHLVSALQKAELWSESMYEQLQASNGSVQNIEEIPQELKDVYRTVWEIPGRSLVDMAADRAVYIDQSQSFNVHMSDPTYGKLGSLHMYTWKKGLKTGMYYLRTRAAVDPVKVTVKPKVVQELACSRSNPECLSCSG